VEETATIALKLPLSKTMISLFISEIRKKLWVDFLGMLFLPFISNFIPVYQLSIPNACLCVRRLTDVNLRFIFEKIFF
jgi:uncharacterized membrane protein YhaH (DUF805 family)